MYSITLVVIHEVAKWIQINILPLLLVTLESQIDGMDVEMEDLTGVPVQEPQPGHPLSGLVPGPPASDSAMVVEENPCETLYIQNLNEKVKPQGVFCPFIFV